MPADPAISVRGLGKSYTLVHEDIQHTTLTEAALYRLRHPFHRPERETFWALQDVNFEVRAGEVVGVIGRNGAGKSTLLKILSRITEPTTGEIDLYGRVGSLLEVGTGFHPELTGRENIYLNGAILGMRHQEIARQFEAIVEFAEVERFLDTPVKRYSSGMYVRLAFAVAAHLNPEILIVDEVLAVGDTAFQKKCLGKMQDVAHEGGRTILFVSHNMAAIRALCNRGLLLRQGAVRLNTDVETAISAYMQEGDATGALVTWTAEERRRRYRDVARFVRACVLDARGEVPVALDCTEPFTLLVEYDLDKTIGNLRVEFLLQNAEGVTICGSRDPEWSGRTHTPGRYQARWTFPPDTLNEGRYAVWFSIDVPNDRVIDRTGFELAFTLEDTRGYGTMAERLPGVLRPRLLWEERRDETLEIGKG